MTETADEALLEKTPPKRSSNFNVTLTLQSPEDFPQKLEFDDEFNGAVGQTIKPLKSIEIGGKNYDEDIKREFDYLSKTNNLETGIDRTKILQDIVDKMVTDENGNKTLETRLVIMNKGKNPNAFVTPDGTIFISQSLLNLLESTDEIASALAHEIKHLQNCTFERQIKAKDSISVGWLHEMASDAQTAKLLEKAGFNSMALRTAIRKISKNGRDFIHQGSLARSAQITGAHLAIDYDTSNKKYTERPSILQREVRPTNMEIVKEALEILKSYQKPENANEEAINKIIKILPKLHPRDLYTAYKDTRNVFHKGEEVSERRFTQTFNELVLSRLKQAGYSNEQSIMFIIALEEEYALKSYYLIDSPQMLSRLPGSVTWPNDFNIQKLNRLIFARDEVDYFHYHPVTGLLSYLTHDIYDVDLIPDGEGLPVTEEIFLDVLAKLSQIYIDDSLANIRRPGYITSALLNYIDRNFLFLTGENPVDEAKIRDFFQKVKDRQIAFEPDIHFYALQKDVSVKHGGKEVKLKQENRDLVVKIFTEMFVREKKELVVDFAYIDEFIKNYNALEHWALEHWQRKTVFETFLNKVAEYFKKKQMPDAERLTLIEYFSQKVESLSFLDDIALNVALKDARIFSNSGKLKEEHATLSKEQNPAIYKFNLRLQAAMALFMRDGPEFYDFLKRQMVNSGIHTANFSKMQLINLCQDLLVSQSGWRSGYDLVYYGQDKHEYIHCEGQRMNFTDFDSFIELPFIRQLFDKREELSFTSIKDLCIFAKDWRKKNYSQQDNYYGFNKFVLFDDTLESIVGSSEIAENFLQLLKQGIREEDYGDLFDFILNFFPEDAQRDEILRELNVRYIRSTGASLEQKIEYLNNHFDRIGPEGMVIVAETIEGFQDYAKFRTAMDKKLTAYLEGSTTVTKIAAADVISSYVSNHFEDLFNTCKADSESKKELSTRMAKKWLYFYMGSYEPSLNGVKLSGTTRKVFRSFNDVLEILHQTSGVQRFAIAFKALTDVNGAFSSDRNREKLATILTTSLGIKPGFISSVLRAACVGGKQKTGDAQEHDVDVLIFPTANMLRPILFRGLDIDAVDLDEIMQDSFPLTNPQTGETERIRLDTLYPREQIDKILRSTTRSLTLFGRAFNTSPNSEVARLSQGSNHKYIELMDILRSLLSKNGGAESLERRKEISDAGTEAVLKGIEVSGSLGVRSLQLATQLHKFSKQTEERLAASFDSNPGLEKLRFWENLTVLAKRDPQIETLLKRIKVFEYLGGGSLFTTYRATINEDGKETQIVFKMLNPNAESFLGLSYKLANDAFEEVKSQGTRDQIHAQTAQMLIDLANNWSIRDINDASFEEDDRAFRKITADFNQQHGENFAIPELTYNSPKLKSEGLARGKTLNQFLVDPQISKDAKREVVERVARFYFHQLKAQPISDADGKEVYLVHSDPHVGNFVVDQTGERAKVWVIDRNMYLRLSKEDVKLLDLLMQDKIPIYSQYSFLTNFVRRILDVNKVVNQRERRRINSLVTSALFKEAGSQVLKRNISGLALMQTALAELSIRNLDIPLRLRLMLRNIEAFKRLGKEYGIDMKSLYKKI